MTTSLVLKNMNPLVTHSGFTIATFTLTDEEGNFDNIANIKYLWMPQHPDIYKGNILCNFLLNLIKVKLLIYSDMRGFMIFEKEEGFEPEVYQGVGGSWARLRLNYVDTNLSELYEGAYILCAP